MDELVTIEFIQQFLQGAGITKGKFVEVFTSLLYRHELLVAEARKNVARNQADQAQQDAAVIVGQADQAAAAAQTQLDAYLISTLDD